MRKKVVRYISHGDKDGMKGKKGRPNPRVRASKRLLFRDVHGGKTTNGWIMTRNGCNGHYR